MVSDRGGGHLTYFTFDLIELDGENLARMPLLGHKTRLAALLKTRRWGSPLAITKIANARSSAGRHVNTA